MLERIQRSAALRRLSVVGEQAIEGACEPCLVARSGSRSRRAPGEILGNVVFELPVPAEVESVLCVEDVWPALRQRAVSKE